MVSANGQNKHIKHTNRHLKERQVLDTLGITECSEYSNPPQDKKGRKKNHGDEIGTQIKGKSNLKTSMGTQKSYSPVYIYF